LLAVGSQNLHSESGAWGAKFEKHDLTVTTAGGGASLWDCCFRKSKLGKDHSGECRPGDTQPGKKKGR